MALLFDCPKAAAIVDVPIIDCPEEMGQIQKVLFQRIYSSGVTKNTIASPLVLASWTPLLAASNGTKVVPSPWLNGPTSEPGGEKTYGGGNQTVGGIEIITGRDPNTFTANLLRVSQRTIKALKKYMGENLGVWYVDEYGRIKGLADDPDNPTTYYPIPIHSLFIGDLKHGGNEEPDMNVIKWKHLPNAFDDAVILTPTDFNPLLDLVTPES